MTHQSLESLAQTLTGSQAQFSFVDAAEAVQLFTSDDYWDVDDDEVEQMALWTLNNWHSRPPNWVYDGEDFYSLADAFALFTARLKQLSTASVVSNTYGPWSAPQHETAATSISVDHLRQFLTGDLIENGRIQETYTVGGGSVTATQLLYALSYLFVLDSNAADAATIDVPATETAPETFAYLETLGCLNCLDTAWSLKPARFQGLAPR